MSGFRKFVLFLVLPLITIMFVTSVLFLVFHQKTWAWLVGNVGTLLVLFAVMLYVVFFDSKKRWPESDWLDRFGKVITFTRY